MVTSTVEQRSDEWHRLRCGRITASNAHRLTSPAKQHTYALELLAERLTGETKPIPITDAMQWGIDKESFARAFYTFETDHSVKEVGFIISDINDNCGCSPDGLIGNDGLLEIKCPNTHNHLLCFDNGPPKEHLLQIQFQLWVTNRQWCDYLSYDPRLTNSLCAYLKRIKRDDVFINKLIVKNINTVEKIIDDFLSKHS